MQFVGEAVHGNDALNGSDEDFVMLDGGFSQGLGRSCSGEVHHLLLNTAA